MSIPIVCFFCKLCCLILCPEFDRLKNIIEGNLLRLQNLLMIPTNDSYLFIKINQKSKLKEFITKFQLFIIYLFK